MGGGGCNNPKFYFFIGIIFNLCLLGFFKYSDFLLENFNAFSQIIHFDFNIPLPHILLPLALSFVTFQQIAFLYDCYKIAKGESKEAIKLKFIDYALFISFFPQLIAGPIVHHREMIPQFARLGTNSSLGNHCVDLTFSARTRKRLINYEFLAKGIFIFCIGLFKKVFIADSFAKWANAGFSVAENGQMLNTIEAWATSLSYTFQLYFDFSGYCDMAVGLGLMFGIVLPINFNSPYKALNIAEFWRRWHITLGRFFKECVYIPLGGNRVKRIFILRNLFIVAFLSGIWHGAGWGFVIWGILHGVAMIIHRIYSYWLANSSLNNHCEKLAFSHNKNQSKFIAIYLDFTKTKFYKYFCWFITFNFISIAWVFFRAENLITAINLFKAMFGFGTALPIHWHRMPELLAQIGGRNETIFYILTAFVLCLAFKNSFELVRDFHSKALKFSLSLRMWNKKIYLKGGGIFVKFIVSALFFSLCVRILLKAFVDENAYSPFLYFNF